MKRNRITLNEQTLNRVITESVRRVLNEIATDTIGSAKDEAYEKWKKLESDPTATQAQIKHAWEQYEKFATEYRGRREIDSQGNKTNLAHKARFDKNEGERIKGKRTYGDHYGDGRKMWRTSK